MRIEDEALFDLFRGPGACDVCGAPVRRREPHHIIHRGRARLDLRWNILGVCAFPEGNNCHYRIHAATMTIEGQRLTREDLFVLVSLREGVAIDDIEPVLWCLARLPRGCRPWEFDRETAGLTPVQREWVVRFMERPGRAR